ncbi:MAG: extracellular solute-binding protein family 1 [Chloroflexi bacterium]|nr:extracellular solute-binding protein family 1 [Chloroflexota bacterium]
MHRVMPPWLRWGLLVCIISASAMLPSARASRSSASQVKLTWEVTNDTFWPPIAKTVIAAYTKLHPNVHIELQLVDGPTYTQKVFIQASAGTLPDILLTADAFTVPFAAHHILLDMQPLLNASPDYNISDVYSNFLNLGRLPGQSGLYMIPFSADAIVTFYNKDMFKAAGLAYPTANWTYAQFLDDAKKLTKTNASGRVTQWGMSFFPTASTGWALWVPWLSGFGGSLLSADTKHTGFSNPGSISGMQAIQDLFVKYKVAPGPTVQFPGDPFLSGNAAMGFSVHGAVAGWSQAIGKKFAWDVQVMPSFPNGKHVNGMGTAGFAVSENSKQRLAAWDVVKFVGSVAGQTALSKLGVTMPIRKSMLNNPVWRVPGLNNDAFVQAIKYGITPPQLSPLDSATNCGTVYAGVFNTTKDDMWGKIVRGRSVAAAAKAADQTINRCIDSLGN